MCNTTSETVELDPLSGIPIMVVPCWHGWIVDSELQANLIMLAIALAVLAFIGIVTPPPLTAIELCEAHPSWTARDCQRITEGLIWLGMSAEQARLSWGSPTTINRSVGSWGVHEQWVYRYKYSADYLYFQNGVLTSWQT